LKIKLSKVGYFKTRQKGSHIRLNNVDLEGKHHITIPNYNPIKMELYQEFYWKSHLA